MYEFQASTKSKVVVNESYFAATNNTFTKRSAEIGINCAGITSEPEIQDRRGKAPPPYHATAWAHVGNCL
ncbi:g4669 [Coccomyxa elongata]